MSLPPDDSQAWKVWLGTIICVVAATIAVAARLLARKISAAPFWWDDWTIIAALVSMALTWSDSTEKAHFFSRQFNGEWGFSGGLSF